ncbi:MAG: type II secretion system protein [Verrucomicrobiales bacterium]|nr:type II secretion system protein [Verrucomicrobiales bacterium]
MNSPSRESASGGFSLPEMAINIAIIGVLSAVGIVQLGTKSREAAARTKMENDVAVLNSAVAAYEGFGGNLEKIDSVELVLAKLKTVSSDRQASSVTGLSGRFVDLQIEVDYQTGEEAATSAPRVYWNGITKRFEVANSGSPGVKAFKLDEDAVKILTESRSHMVNYAVKSTWVWDYDEEGSHTTGSTGATTVATTDPDATDPGFELAKPPEKDLIRLKQPEFSIPGQKFLDGQFPSSIEVLNPNPPGTSDIVRNVDYGGWEEDYRPIPISPGTVVQAQAVPRDPTTYSPSAVATAEYGNLTNRQLSAPTIEFSAIRTSGVADSIQITIKDDNKLGSEIMYQIIPLAEHQTGGAPSNSDFQKYAGPLIFTRADFPEGLVVNAYARSTLPGITDSDLNSRTAR